MKCNKLKRVRFNSGAALILTLLCLTLLSVIAMGLVGISLTQSRISTNYYSNTLALYVAQAGVSRARSEISKNPNWVPNPPYSGTLKIDGQTGTYTVSVTPAPGNKSNTYKVWTVTSTGSIGGFRRTLNVILESESLARYVFYTDSNIFLWGKQYTSVNYSGPVHTNGYFGFYGKPQFDSPVTSSNKGDSYYDPVNRIYTQGGQKYSDPALFYHYVFGYDKDKPVAAPGTNSFYFAGGQPIKALPGGTDAQKENATYVIAAEQAVVTFLGNGNMEVVTEAGTFIYPCNRTTLCFKGPVDKDGKPKLDPWGEPILPEVSVEGTVKGNVTLVSDGDIYITDNLVYKNKNVDTLALIASNYIVVYTDPYDVRDIEINGMLFSLNRSFYVDQYNIGPPRGTLRIFGGIIQKYQGAIGVYNFGNGKVLHGYAQDFVFDPRFYGRPPDNVPVTGKIRIKAWKDNAAYD